LGKGGSATLEKICPYTYAHIVCSDYDVTDCTLTDSSFRVLTMSQTVIVGIYVLLFLDYFPAFVQSINE